MHEYSIAYDLYATSRRAAIENHAKRVKKISVEMGKMAMANPEQVCFLFETIKEEDPIFANAVLDCHETEPQTKCPCGYSGSEVFVCPQCGSLPELVKGREIVVTNIEIEVED